MIWCHREPSLEEILADCIIQAMMKADNVDPNTLASILRRAARKPNEVIKRNSAERGRPD